MTAPDFKNVLDKAPFGVHYWELLPDGKLILAGANRTADQILKLDNKQFVGKTIEEAFPAFPLEITEACRRIAAHGGRCEIEQVPYREGRIAGTFDVHAVHIGPNQSAVFFTDITKRKRAENALRESEERYRSLIELSPDAIAIHSKGKFVFVNSNTAELLGVRNAQELIGRKLLDFVHPDYRDSFQERVRRVQKEGKAVPLIEEKLVRIDGTVIDVEVAAIPFVHKNKPATQVVMRDISRREKSEELILKLFRAVEQTDEIIFMTEHDGTITYVNPAFESIYGYTREEAVGKTPRILKSGVLSKEYYEEFWKTLLGGQSVRREIVNKTKGGRLISILTFVNPLFNKPGALVGFIAVQADITERKQMEEKLRQSEEQYRLISENVADLIAVLDLEGKRLYNSPSYKDLLGDPQSLRGTDSFEEIHPEDRDRVRHIFQETVTTGIGQRAEYRFLLKDGSFRYVESQGSVIKDQESKPAKILVVSRDVTEKKRLEEQFLRAQRMESIGTLAGGIAHDLNNVLAPIMMAIELLRMRNPDRESQRMFDTLEASAERGSGIVKQVLAFSRGLGGERLVLQPKPLIDEIAKIIKETFPKSISLNLGVPEGIWTLLADPTQIHQVLLNLCVNARDAMPDGGTLTISLENIQLDESYARMQSEAKAGPYVMIAVSDTGDGISPEIIDRIFDPFFTTKEINKGTGLGLSTVLGIIRSHGGFINVYSELRKGTVFKTYLPAHKAPEGPSTEQGEPELLVGHGEGVLVVDDELSIREITKETLEAHGYSVITASDGTEALSLYVQRKNEIDVVITDLLMPYLDGATTVRALQRINPLVKVIVASGLASDEYNAKSPGSNVQAFLMKPYTAEKLLTTLSRVLTDKK